jgi:cell division transport system permease protein
VNFLAGPARRLAGLYGSEFRLSGLGFVASLAVLGAAAALGWSGSWLAASRHIKAMEPT